MSKSLTIASMVLLAGLAAPAMAQDSISRNADGGNGLPGDGLSPWTTGAAGYQRTAYVVDLAQLNTSWGQQGLGIAPVIKSSKTGTLFFGSLFGSNAMSATARTGVPAASSTYDLWSNAPRAGVNREENDRAAVTSAPGPASTKQFGVIMSEFATTDFGINANQVITGVVNVDPASPGRLYVTRIVAATNSVPPNGDNSQFGVGAVDSDGNAFFRVDPNGAIGTAPVAGNNIFRIASLARSTSSSNEISNAGGADAAASDWFVNNFPLNINPPSAVPAQLAGGRGAFFAANFQPGYLHGATPPATDVPGGVHRPGTTDHRGAPHFFPGNLLNAANAVGTGGMLTVTGGNTNAISLWGVTATGAPVGGRALILSPTVSDPTSTVAYSITFPGGTPANRLEHYGSQTAFRGGAPVSIGRDTAGRGLVAGVAYVRTTGFGNTSPANAIVVGRFQGTGPVQWVVAGWTAGTGVGSFPSSDLTQGKEILGDGGLDGVIGTGDAGDLDGILDLNPASPTFDAPIGRLASTHERGGAAIGPSIGGVSFDSFGNLYFNAAVVLKKFNSTTQQFFDDYDAALIRANYNPNTFSYRLELILEQGNVFTGVNSGTPYQVQFLEVHDNNSIASGTTWGNAAGTFAFNNTDPATLDPGDSRFLGGVVVGANIVYDVDGDGQFVDPTGNSTNPDSVDEAYNALLYIGHRGDGAPACPGQGPNACGPGDWNEDGVVDFNDLLAFLNDYNIQTECSDVNADGTVDFNDLLEFLNRYNAGC